MSEDGDPRAAVAQGAAGEDLAEAQLVLTAVGIAHDLERRDGRPTIVVSRRDEARARDELAAFRREDRGPPPRPARADLRRGTGASLLAVLLLAGIHALATVGWLPADTGLLDAERVRSGEWTRLVTALTLHADLAHLAANLTFLGLLGWAVAQQLGGGLAFAVLLAAGTLANVASVLLRAGTHRSLGASTAVFAALGILGILAAHRRGAAGASRWLRWAPPVVALGFLGWLGTGGERVDVLGHLLGLLSGLAAGLLLRHEALTGPPRATWQRVAAMLSLALVACA